MSESVKNNDSNDWDGWDDWNENEYAPPPASAPAKADSAPAVPAPLGAVPTRSPAPRPGRPQSGEVAPGFPIPHKGKPNNFPGFIARSAMFRVSSCGDAFHEPTIVKAAGCELTLSGPRLSMRDKHIWETAIQIAKERAPNIAEAFEIELRDFSRRMGSSNQGGRALASLWESLERLARCRVEFQIGESCKGIGSLLATAFRADNRLYLRLNPDFALPALRGDKQFLFDQKRRSELPTSLAQWLHDFFSTHQLARDIDLLYLRELCGYEGSPRNFPRKLKDAMDSLVAIAPNLISSFEIVENGRRSDSWLLRVALGDEKRSFLPAERVIPESRAGRAGRGRVAL